MSRRAPLRVPRSRALVALALAAVVVLPGCSDDEASGTRLVTSGPSASAPSATASGSPGGADAVAFCAQLQSTFAGVSETMQTAQGNDLGPALDEVVAAFDAVEPPPEIAEAMSTLREDYAALAQAATSSDLTTEEGQAAFAAQYQAISSEATGAQEGVQSWLATNCPTPSPSAS